MIPYSCLDQKKRNSPILSMEQCGICISFILKKLYKIVLLIGLLIPWTGHFLSAQQPILEQTISLQEQTNTIEDILSQIEVIGGFTFSYVSSFPAEKKVHLQGGVKSVHSFLEEIFSGIPVEFEEKRNKIHILNPESGEMMFYQSLRGTVIDEVTRSPLPGAHIFIQEDNIMLATTSDADGQFVLSNIPVGRHDVKVSFIGFEEKIIPNIVFGSAKEVVTEVRLIEKPFSVEEVVIKTDDRKSDPKNRMATVSARSFSVEETSRYPAALNDPSRMALVFAGVTMDEDASNEIIIRGNSPNGLLWRLEGVEIPNPNHFAIEGSSTGFVSIISSNLLDNSDFFTGAFPAEYGNALSGVFDISLRKGNNQQREHTFQFGFLGTDLAFEGPFSKNYNGSYLVNFRYATLGLMKMVGFEFKDKLLPSYTDLSFKLHFPTKKAGSFSIWCIGGNGVTESKAILDSTMWERVADSTKYRYTTNVVATGLTHLYMPNNKSYVKSVLSYSHNHSTVQECYVDYVSDIDKYIFKPYVDENLFLKSIRASVAYTNKISSKFSIKAGGIFSHLMFDYFDVNYKIIEGIQDTSFNIDSQGSTQSFQSFIQGKYKITNNISLNTGLHYLYFNLNGESIIEPRLGLKWDINPRHSLAIGFGKHSRHETLSTYFIQVPQPDGTYSSPNKNIDLTKSIHAVLSYDLNISRNLHLKTECYYQYLYDIPVRNVIPYILAPINNSYRRDSLFNCGTGRNYGVEITLERFFSKGFYFMSATSLFDAKIDPGNDTLYHTKYNARFAQTIVSGKEFELGVKKQKLLGINTKLIWAGGNRGKFKGDSLNPADPQDRYGKQYQDYFRIDVSFSYRINKPRVSHVISLDIQNATNRENWINRKSQQTGIIPVFNYRLEF